LPDGLRTSKAHESIAKARKSSSFISSLYGTGALVRSINSDVITDSFKIVITKVAAAHMTGVPSTARKAWHAPEEQNPADHVVEGHGRPLEECLTHLHASLKN